MNLKNVASIINSLAPVLEKNPEVAKDLVSSLTKETLGSCKDAVNDVSSHTKKEIENLV